MADTTEQDNPRRRPTLLFAGMFVTGLAGGLVACALVGTAAMLSWPMVQAQILAPAMQRLDAVEERQTEAPPSPAAGAEDPRLSALTARVEQLSGDVESLRRAMPEPSAILRLADSAEQAQKAARDVSHRQSGGMLLAAGQLRDAVDRGDPYVTELAAARHLAVAEETESLDALAPWAAAGVARADSLIESFPALADRVERAATLPVGDGFWSTLATRLSTIVSVRRIDGHGGGVAAILARAEAKVKIGRLDQALDELSGLDGRAAAEATPWIQSATARSTADRALSRLSALAAVEASRSGD